MSNAMSNPLKWHGGKSYLADWIISLMPPHTHYVEPFFGGGAVLFRKSPEGVSEVVNDVNGELMNFWETLGCPTASRSLIEGLKVTPFSERRFDYEKRNPYTPIGSPDHMAAQSFFIRYRQSRQGLGKDFATLSRNRTRRGMNEQVSSWLSAVDGLPEAHERLKRVVILNRDAHDVIRSQDGPNTLFYLDPPYLHETRVTTSDYAFEMSEQDHYRLLVLLSEIKGTFLLSGYHSRMYDEEARRYGWTCHEKQIDNKASAKKTKSIKTECVWSNALD